MGNVNHGDYPIEIGKIISANCSVSGCHNGTSAAAANGYNLESWQSMFSGSNTGSPVIPYSSKFSSMCYFINTYSDLGLQNLPTMPINKKTLSRDDVKKIEDWIDAGAPDMKGNVKWADNPLRKKLYATNQGCDVVTVFDAETQLPMRFIEVGNKPGTIEIPHQVRVSPDGKYWYVVFINNNIMQKYRCSDDSYVGDIPLCPAAAGTGTTNALDWNTFVISKDSKRAYCASWTQSGKVAAVDLDNMKLIHFIGGQYYPHAIALNNLDDKIYVGAQTGNFIVEIDTAFSSANQLSLENGPINLNSSLDPHDIYLSANNQLLITCQKSNEVRVFDIASGLVTNTITTGKYPQEIIYSPTFSSYFVSCTYDSTTFPGSMGLISRINAFGYAVTNLKVGYQPHGIATDENKGYLYVTSRNIPSNGPAPHHTSQCQGRNGFVNFIDMASFTVLPKHYELSVDPYFIFARP
ncbi:MAG: YncE family protein [Bacteroidetes bacterium]|nr:YncE family protein [Bacteroidota bacterium]